MKIEVIRQRLDYVLVKETDDMGSEYVIYSGEDAISFPKSEEEGLKELDALTDIII